MYRGQPYIPSNPCKPCKGTGRIGQRIPPGSYDCTSCNGTGIDGNPRWLFLTLVLWIIFLSGLVSYCATK